MSLLSLLQAPPQLSHRPVCVPGRLYLPPELLALTLQSSNRRFVALQCGRQPEILCLQPLVLVPCLRQTRQRRLVLLYLLFIVANSLGMLFRLCNCLSSVFFDYGQPTALFGLPLLRLFHSLQEDCLFALKLLYPQLCSF